jgi:hypothetical protein
MCGINCPLSKVVPFKTIQWQRNERANVLANEGLCFRTGLDIHTRARTRLLTEWQERWNNSEMGRYCYSIVPRVSVEAWIISAVDERIFLEAMSISRLASNHTGTRANLHRINGVQDALCQCMMVTMGYDTIDHELWKCGLHCALRNELQEKLRAAGIDHGRSIRNILPMRNMVALRIIFEYSKDIGLYI